MVTTMERGPAISLSWRNLPGYGSMAVAFDGCATIGRRAIEQPSSASLNVTAPIQEGWLMDPDGVRRTSQSYDHKPHERCAWIV